MDNGDSLLEDLDQSDLFGNHSEGNGSLFNWADEFLGDDHDPSNLALDAGNLATNVNSTYHLTSQNYAVTSTNPLQLQSLSSQHLPTQANAGITVLQQGFVSSSQSDGSSSQMLSQDGQHVLLKTASGQQIQVTRQMHLQLQQQLLQQQQQQQLQQQQQQQQSSGFSNQQPVTLLGRSVTPNSGMALSFTNTQSISQTLSQLTSTSPAPNMSVLQLPASMQQHQNQMQGPQQIQFSNGTILQLPFAGAQSGLIQGQTVLGNQQSTMVNAQNAVIQNPNIVNVNMGTQQMLQTQQRSNFQLANFQTAPQPPFNIQGTLIRTAEGKNILIPSQNLAQPINIQGLSLATPLQIQQPSQNTISSVLLSQPQPSGLTMDNRANQGLQQIVLNHGGRQLLLQSGAVTVSQQPQNIVVRAATAQPNILQLQPSQQIQTLTAHTMNQPVRLMNQSGQSAVTMVNIGGQNIPLSQLSAHLGNLQNQHVQQQVPKQQPQQQISHPSASASPLTFSQGQQNVPQQLGGGQQRVLLGNSPSVTSVNVSGDSQMQMILQQIQDSLKKSQAATNSAVSKTLQTFSAVHALPNMAVTSIKQEPGVVAQSNRVVTQTFVPAVSVKSEASIIDGLIKKEADVKPFMASCSGGASSNISQLLQNNVQNTPVTITVSNATTPMSLYLVSNSAQNVGGTSSSISSALTTNSSMTNVQHSSSDLVNADTATISIQRQQPSGVMSVQTVQLPVEFQQHFQRVQQQIKNVQAATNLTQEQKHEQLQQLYMFQKKILLKGRVISSTKTEANQQQMNSVVSHSQPLSFDSQLLTSNKISSVPNQISTTMQQAVTASNIGPKMSTMNSSSGPIMSSGSASPQFLPAPSPSSSHSSLPVNHLPPTPGINVSIATQSQAVETPQSNTEASGAQVAVPTQIKIADKVLTLSLTQAQKDKVLSYLDRMSPEQQQQYLQSQQHVLQRIQRQQQLNAQVRAQVEAQKKLAGPSLSQAGAAEFNDSEVSVKLEPLSSSMATTGLAMQPLAEVRKIPGPISVAGLTQVKVEPTTTLQRGTKRSFMDIPKQTLFNQQIRQDQNHAVAPDTKRPFKSKGDACRRLLRFHVFQSYGPCGTDFDKFDSNFGDISDDLLQRKDKMLEKFRHLLFQETIREQPSSELVMLQRMQNQELRKLIEEERQQVSIDPASFRPMPLRYLCNSADGQTSRTESERCESLQAEHMDDTGSDNGVNLDCSYDDHVDVIDDGVKEVGDSEVKVRKLVIKTDGMRFSSTFKRNSLDHSFTSCSEMGEESESGGEVDSPEKTSHYTGLYDPRSSVDNSDEDTNEYAGDNTCSFEEETKQAAILISSAEEGENSQLDDVYSFGNSNRMSGQSAVDINSENRQNYELTDQSFHRSNHYESLNSVEQLTGFDPSNDGYIPDQSPLSDADTGDETFTQKTEDSLDQFDMYQPITECLTDSEENSYIPTAGTDRRQSVGSNINSAGSNAQLYESDPESDQEVKAQMESAIHSILSLSSGDAPPPVFMYSGSQQNHVLTNNQVRPLSSGHRNSAAHLSSIDNQMVEFEHDLDDAVNSILI
ncbi:helicase domino-like isoform X3 [Dreissena polymorpha]|nr:helicase domino-like isoform X2 [Dreissena polymorpha]XP_052243489.1 helicase domino-like isoform X3 [Dreissena polymorpha]